MGNMHHSLPKLPSMPMRLKDQASAYPREDGRAVKPKKVSEESSPNTTSTGAPSTGASNSPGALVGNGVTI